MTAHSLLGASSAHRWLNCPGSFHLSQTAPHRRPSIYAAIGSVAHQLIEETVRVNAIEVDPAVLGDTYPCDGHTVTIDQDLLDGVNVMLAYLQQASMLSDWMEVEFRVSLNTYFQPPPPVPLFGTVDAGLLSLFDETLEIVDYKNGAGVVVTPAENPQMLFYAAGVLQHLPATQRALIENIKLTIVQPHASGVAPIRSWETSLVDLLMWVDETLVPGVAACVQDNAPLVPGSWCRFCPVSHACPKLQQDAVAMAQREFADSPPSYGPDQIAEDLDTAERAQLWIDRVRNYAIDQLQDRVRIPGWGLVPTRPTRRWVNDETTTAGLLVGIGAAVGVTHDALFETKLRSPAQIEKEMARTQAGRRVWDNQVGTELVEAKSSGVKLSRTGVSPGKDFTDEN